MHGQEGGRWSPHLLEMPPVSHLLHVIGRTGVHLASGWYPSRYWQLEAEAMKVEDTNSKLGLETELRCFGLGTFEGESDVAQVGLKLNMYLRVTLNSWSPRLHLPSTGITGIHYQAWFMKCWRRNSGLQLDKRSVSRDFPKPTHSDFIQMASEVQLGRRGVWGDGRFKLLWASLISNTPHHHPWDIRVYVRYYHDCPWKHDLRAWSSNSRSLRFQIYPPRTCVITSRLQT